ncbi:histidine phosphatase family protein [Dyella jiangningensis]|uniref:Histidine phosphatase family protein n=1 Tax=Dyella jiangningensis TaxID=1379159 RepID=A0A328P4Z1_9GAMM|nr:histidine phosphatase family protein [Dyella jiangningensis]RAO77109.1 histidine phosphatase family protein [Dyella jiangningensis]
MAELLLIRHGQASFSAEDYDQLSPTGERQSVLLGEWLATCSPAPDLVAIGPRVRHRDTAMHCLHAAGLSLSPMPLHGLDEVDHLELLARLRPDLAAPGALRAAMKQSDDPHRAFQRLFVEALERWSSGAHDAEYSCTWATFRANALAVLKTLGDHPSRMIWAFTSGGPIAVIAGSLLDVPPSQAFRLSWPLVNTGVTRIRLGSRASTLVTYNTWPHLERIGDAQLVTLR